MRRVVIGFAKLFAVLLLITHLAACLWLLCARHERQAGDDATWYDDWNEDAATWFV
jgi:hypothetical protein